MTDIWQLVDRQRPDIGDSRHVYSSSDTTSSSSSTRHSLAHQSSRLPLHNITTNVSPYTYSRRLAISATQLHVYVLPSGRLSVAARLESQSWKINFARSAVASPGQSCNMRRLRSRSPPGGLRAHTIDSHRQSRLVLHEQQVAIS